MVISIEGCIGSGKSTTARLVALRLSFSTILEETAVHPFLADFYANPKLYGLETELGFALLRYHQLRLATKEASLVCDFSPAKGLVFASMNLGTEDLALYEQVYRHLTRRLVKPDVGVFLDLQVEVLMQRIKARARPYELDMPASYLHRLRESYLLHLPELADSVAVVSVAPTDSRDEVAEKAFLKLKGYL